MNYLPLAEQCGLIEEHPVNHSSVEYLADLQRFAELVAAHETEACAELCHKYAQQAFNNSSQNAAVELRDAIWARRQK
jgi:hypothetical protein